MHTEDGPLCVDDGFDDAVWGFLSSIKPLPKPPKALMVGAVDGTRRTIELVEDRAGKIADRVELVLALPLMGGMGGQILDDGAAKAEVDDLDSFADAKDWPIALQKCMEKGKLCEIQCPVNIAGA